MKISFVIVEYHSVEDSKSCCMSVRRSVPDGWECEMIISSNSVYSLEKQKELIENSNEMIEWVFNARNGGFAYAMNEGLKIATGEVLVIMNPDVKVREGLRDMLTYFLLHDKIGIIAPKIVNKSDVIQDSFRNFITPLNFVGRHLKRLSQKAEVHVGKEPRCVDWVIGAFMMTRRSVYEEIGGLDNRYFMYCEDMDWCKRAHRAGYDVTYFPQAVVEYEGTRSARHSWKYAWIFVKSLFRYWFKFI